MLTHAAPVLSIVLSTYNRADTLRGAVESLLALEAGSPAHELIVVDNNSRDHTRAVVHEFLPAAADRLRYVFEGKQGLSHARNAGIAVARGSYVAFTDDDVRAAPDWASALVRAFDAHPEADFVGGKVLPLWPSEPPAWLTKAHWGPLALVDYGERGFVTSVDNPLCLVGANMAYRREVFAKFGGFDPHYQHERGAVTAVEDHEFELRLYTAGRRGCYEPSAVIHAEVQANRLTKAYHRKWHFDHGRAMVRMLPPGHLFDTRTVPRPRQPGDRLLFGAPLHLYRAVGVQLAGLAGAHLRGRAADAVAAEGELREALGAIHFFTTTRRDPVTGTASRAHPRVEAYAPAGAPAAAAAPV